MQILKANELKKESEKLCVLSIGDVGTGKSNFASTFPQPLFVFNTDDKNSAYIGTDSTLANFSSSPEDWVQLERIKNQIKKEVKDGKWATVVVDSITSLSNLALERSMQLDPKRSPAGGAIWNVHYSMRKNLVEGFLRQIISFRQYCNIVITCHYEPEKNEDGATIGYYPLIPGSLSREIPSMFDEVYLHQVLQKDNKHSYTLTVVPKGLYKAVRSGIRGKESTKPVTIDNSYTALVQAFYCKME